MTTGEADLAGRDTTPGTLRVDVVGDLDIATTDAFLTAAVARFGESPLDRVEVDMSRAQFLDSTGLGALVELRRAAHYLGAETKLVNVDRRTERLLRIVGLDGVFLDPSADASQSRPDATRVDD